MHGPIRIVALILLIGGAGAAADDAKVRGKAVRDLAKAGPESIPKVAVYLSDPETSVRLEAVKAIAGLDTQRSLDPLVKATSDNDPEIQMRATDGLINFYLPGYMQSGVTAPIKRISKGIKSKFTDTNDQVIDAYVQVRPEIIEALGKLARGGASMESRANAARGLGILRGRAAVPDLIEAVKSKDDQVIYEALIALEKIHDESAGPAIAYRLRDPVEKVQIAAIEATGILQNKSAINQVRDALDRSKNPKVRRAALTTIAMLPDPQSRGLLMNYLADTDDGLRTAAIEGIARLQNPSDRPAVEKAFADEKKGGPRLAAAFGNVALGNIDMTEFAPLRYLVNNLNSQAYRGVARSYLIELARDGVARRQLYLALKQSPTREEKTGLAQVLAASGDPDSIPYLETLSQDPDTDVAKEGLRALQTLRSRGQ
ncbi:MAG: HEAT repeat domain-containing protein [Bryobacteraceae bacterium]